MKLQNISDWKFADKEKPEVGKTVWAVVDSLCCDEEPVVAKLTLELGSVLDGKQFYKWRVVDFDPEEQEEFLHQCLDVIFWRYS